MVSSLGYTNYLDNETLLNLKGTYDYILIDVPPFEFVSEQIALIELADALLISTRMNICGKNELMCLLSQLGAYREKIGGIIATACTKKILLLKQTNMEIIMILIVKEVNHIHVLPQIK